MPKRKFADYPKPEVGQVWVSADPRDADLQLRRKVLKVEGGRATLDGYPTTRVRVDRMRPVANGYRLIYNTDGTRYTHPEDKK